MKTHKKKFWLGTLATLCTFAMAGCNVPSTSSQSTQEATTVTQSETLDGTWELTDVKTTLRKSFVLRGADPTQ